MMTLFERLDDWPGHQATLWAFAVFFTLAVVFNIVTALALVDAMYPDETLVGPFPAWWFTFDDEVLKKHYAALLEQNTMSTFVDVQYLDFGLMSTTGAALFLIAIIVARRLEQQYGRATAYAAALLWLASPIMDMFENIILLTMLSDPRDFPPSSAIFYSSFATAKVLLFTLGTILFLASAIALGFASIRRLFRGKAT